MGGRATFKSEWQKSRKFEMATAYCVCLKMITACRRPTVVYSGTAIDVLHYMTFNSTLL